MDRFGHFMHTNTGRFWPLDPRVEDLRIEDIAHHLSRICRYNGAVDGFYSVAEHCVHVSYIGPAEEALERLLHGAAEFAIGDVIRPLKHAELLTRLHPNAHGGSVAAARSFADAYKAIEEPIEHAVALRFGLKYPWPESVKFADEAVCNAELDHFFKGRSFGICSDPTMRAPVEIQCWSPDEAKQRFIDRYVEAMGERSGAAPAPAAA